MLAEAPPAAASTLIWQTSHQHGTAGAGISVVDVTADVNAFLGGVARDTAGASELTGSVTIASQHTTVAVTVNEHEERLMDDLRLWLARLAPPGDAYLHNDLDRRMPPSAPRCPGLPSPASELSRVARAFRVRKPLQSAAVATHCLLLPS